MVGNVSDTYNATPNRRLTDIISDALFQALDEGDTATARCLKDAIEARLAFEQSSRDVDRRVQHDPRLNAARQVVLSTTHIGYTPDPADGAEPRE